MKLRQEKPAQTEIQQLCTVADTEVSTLTAALEQQTELNEMLGRWDAFVLASDLEGGTLVWDSERRRVELS